MRSERPEESVYSLDQAVFGHGDNVESDQDQMFPFAELPAVAESIVVLIDGRRASEEGPTARGWERARLLEEATSRRAGVRAVALGFTARYSDYIFAAR